MKGLISGYLDPSPENFKRLVSVMAFDDKFAADELAEQRSKNALANPEHLQNFIAGLGPWPVGCRRSTTLPHSSRRSRRPRSSSTGATTAP